LINKIIHGQYAPGSIFKMIVALAALEEKIIDKNTTVHCPGHYDFQNHRFYCWNWKKGGHGHVHVQSALAQSCDTFFYHVATKLGIDAIAGTARAFGFGQTTGIELPGEKIGLVPTREWKRMAKKQAWTGGDTINVSIGQGYLLSTPLQQARMVAAFVNGLYLVTPHLILKNIQSTGTPLAFNHDHIDLICKGTCDVVNQPWGTAYRSRIENAAFRMGGKTASTQVSRITEQQRIDGTHNERPYHLREHAMFTGYAPVDNPRYVVAVLVEHGGSAARVAAPLGRDILLALHDIESTSS
jgi:penicillin-binding protein 2